MKKQPVYLAALFAATLAATEAPAAPPPPSGPPHAQPVMQDQPEQAQDAKVEKHLPLKP